jgi:hypothetical protein
MEIRWYACMLWVVWQRSRTRWALVKASASLLEGMGGGEDYRGKAERGNGMQQWEPVSSAVEGGCERCMKFFRSGRLSEL